MFNHIARVKKLSLVSAALLFAGPALAAQTQPVVVYGESAENVRTVHVSYADLELASAKGERQLHSRVSGAVKDVCLFGLDGPRLQGSGYYQCAGDAWASAKPQIANAISRANELALSGKSSIAAAAITISVR